MSPLDLQGPLARNVHDVALLLSAMSTPGGRDPMAFPHDAAGLKVDPESRLISQNSDRYLIRSRLCADCQFASGGLRGADEDTGAYVAHLDERDPDLATSADVFWILRGVYFAAAHKKHYEEHYDDLGDIVRANLKQR